MTCSVHLKEGTVDRRLSYTKNHEWVSSMTPDKYKKRPIKENGK